VTTNLLQVIVGAAQRAAAERERVRPAASLETGVSGRPPRAEAFSEALARAGINVIAECKRRSPSRGVLRRSYDPAAIAAGYERGGAAAISVLTEPGFFDGSLDHLRAVRAAVGIPVLRKDFIVSSYQVAEARAAGADAVLLIVAALGREALGELLRQSTALGLAALVEVHDEAELDQALDAGAAIVGVNSRDLRSMEVHPSTFERLVGRIPDDVVAVAESGLRSAARLTQLRGLGYDAFLIGEHFVTQADPGAALAALVAEATGGPS